MVNCVSCNKEIEFPKAVCSDKCLEEAFKYDELFNRYGKTRADKLFEGKGKAIKRKRKRRA